MVAISQEQIILVGPKFIHQLIQNWLDILVETDGRLRSGLGISMTLSIFEESINGDLSQFNGILELELRLSSRWDLVNTSRSNSCVASECIFCAIDFNTCVIDTKAKEISPSCIACLLNVVDINFDLHYYSTF
jgi:hypothetical protein